jgi:hypothetical protein
MTDISYDFRDNGTGQPFVGTLRISLNARLVASGQWYPPSLVVTVPINGTGTLSLTPSDIHGVDYLFQLYRGADLVDSWVASVPDVGSALPMSTLKPSSIAYADLQQSILSVVRYLYADPLFWQQFLLNVFKPKGVYNSTSTYRLGDLVTQSAKTWVCISRDPIVGVFPTVGAQWQILLQ